jgi:hypothetical protein
MLELGESISALIAAKLDSTSWTVFRVSTLQFGVTQIQPLGRRGLGVVLSAVAVARFSEVAENAPRSADRDEIIDA